MKRDHSHERPTCRRLAGPELSRRSFLRGVGVSLALPPLSRSSRRALAAAAAGERRRWRATASGAPLRMAFVYVPNGVHQGHWWPKGLGEGLRAHPDVAAARKGQAPGPGPGRTGPRQRLSAAWTGRATMRGRAARF